jgi:hypothetical protein
MARWNEAVVATAVALTTVAVSGCLESLATRTLAVPIASTERSTAPSISLSMASFDEAFVAPRPAARARYVLLPEVTVSPTAEPKLQQIANGFHRRTGKGLVVTSGTRGPKRQARAMYELLDLGTDLATLYKNSKAAAELEATYEAGRRAGRDESTIVAHMAALIERQMKRGVFVSAHLRAGAVDIRNRNMSETDKRAFLDSVNEVDGIRLLEEAKPPHYHLEIR